MKARPSTLIRVLREECRIAALASLNPPHSLIALETPTARSVRRSHERVELEMLSSDRFRYSQSSLSSLEARQGSEAVPVRGFRRRGRRSPTRRPVQCQSSISWCAQLHQGFPWRQNVVGSNEAHRHCQQEARTNQTRRCRRWNVKEPASSADDKPEDESDDGCSHSSALVRTRSNRNRNPISGADAKSENAIG